MNFLSIKKVSAYGTPRFIEGLIFLVVIWPFLIKNFGTQIVGELALVISAAAFGSAALATGSGSVLPALLIKKTNTYYYWSYLTTSIVITFTVRLSLLVAFILLNTHVPFYTPSSPNLVILFCVLFLMSFSRVACQTHLTLHGEYKRFFLIYCSKPLLFLPISIYYAIDSGFDAFLLVFAFGEIFTGCLETMFMVLNKEFSFSKFSLKKNIKSFLEMGVFGILNGFTDVGMQFLQRFLIALFFGMGMLGSLVISFQILNSVTMLNNSIILGMAKEIAKIISSSKEVVFSKLSFRLDFFSAISIFLILFSHYIIIQNQQLFTDLIGEFDQTFLNAVCWASIIYPLYVINFTISTFNGKVIEVFKVKLPTYFFTALAMIFSGFLDSWLIFCAAFASMKAIEVVLLSYLNNNRDVLFRMAVTTLVALFYFYLVG